MGSGDMTDNICYTPPWFSDHVTGLSHVAYFAFKTDLHTMCGDKTTTKKQKLASEKIK